MLTEHPTIHIMISGLMAFPQILLMSSCSSDIAASLKVLDPYFIVALQFR
jgi:hypothetical protein